MKFLIILYDGFNEVEYLIPLMALHELKIPFDNVGLSNKEISGMVGLKAFAAKTLNEIDSRHYDALFLPGIDRENREHVLSDRNLHRVLQEFDREKKLIAAVCAAPIFLGVAGILRGKSFCSDVESHPAFEGATHVSSPAIRDGHIITGLGSRIFHFTALLIEALAGEEKAADYRRWFGLQGKHL